MANVHCDPPSSKVHPSFNSNLANIILRSSEGTLYRIPSFVLCNTTAYFNTILSAQSPFGQQANNQSDPILPVAEKDDVLERILRLISGLETPVWETFEEIESVMSLAEKWGAPGPISVIRSAITAPKFLAEPLRLYGLATRFGWEEEAKLASTHTLKLALYDEENAEKLERLPTKALLDLLGLHRRRRDMFRSLLDSEENFARGNDPEQYCTGCGEKVDNHSWRELKARMFLEMDQRPFGDTLLDLDMEKWQEAIACWSAKCRTKECGIKNYDKLSTLRIIQNCLDRLPTTI